MYNENHFVSYEQAKKLKSLGFNEKCIQAYDNCEILYLGEGFSIQQSNLSTQIAAPLYQQAIFWLLKKLDSFLGISIELYCDKSGHLYSYLGEENSFNDLPECVDQLLEILEKYEIQNHS